MLEYTTGNLPQQKFLASLRPLIGRRGAAAGISFTPEQLRSLTDIGDYSRASAAERTKMANPFAPRDAPRDAPREGSTGSQVVDVPDDGNTLPRAVNPYATTLPPLSPKMLQALEDRRALSLSRLQEAEATAASQRQSAELANVGRLLGIEEETGLERRKGMSDLAARGVARSPLFANPFRRELARQQQQQIGESQQQLTSTLDKLGAALRAAQFLREEELSQLAFDEARERSNVNRLLGVE